MAKNIKNISKNSSSKIKVDTPPLFSEESKVTSLVIGDPHFKYKAILDGQEFVEKSIKVAKEQSPTFIVVLGDTLDTHEIVRIDPHILATEWISELSAIAPVYLLIGNHDLCVSKDTPILMWNGDTKMSQDINIGDKLVGDDGTVRTVQKLTNGHTKMYDVKQLRGETYTVTEKHILSLKVGFHKSIFWNSTKQRWTIKWIEIGTMQLKSKFFENKIDAQNFLDNIEDIDVIDISVEDYLQVPKNVKERLYGFKSSAIQWPKAEVLLDPYILGMWLGDGCQKGAAFTSADTILINRWVQWGMENNSEIVHSRGYNFHIRQVGRTKPNTPRVPLNSTESSCYNCPACKKYKFNDNRAPSLACANSIELKRLIDGDRDIYNYLSENCSNEQLSDLNNINILKELYEQRLFIEKGYICPDGKSYQDYSNPLRKIIKEYNLYKNKHIPKEYLVNDEETRLKLLAGFIDTDGSVFDNGRSIIIAQGGRNIHMIDELVFLCRSLGFSVGTSLRESTNAKCINIFGDIEKIPTLLGRKRCVPIMNNGIDSRGRKCADKSRTSINVSPSSETEYYGWTLDENRRFLLGDFTVTHNCNNRQYLSDKHIFNPLKKWHNVTVVDKPVYADHGDKAFVFCPYVEPGRFVEALDTLINQGETWEMADCIFGHQEFRGCKMGAIVSEKGDQWDENYPPVITGHIHDSQTVGNVYMPGSAYQHSFGENSNKRIWFVTFGQDEDPGFLVKKIDLGMKKKKIVHLDIDEIDTFDTSILDKYQIKLCLKGTSEQFKLFRSGKKYTSLLKDGIKFSYNRVVSNLQNEIRKGGRVKLDEVSFLGMLRKVVSTKNEETQKIYSDIVGGSDPEKNKVVYNLIFEDSSEDEKEEILPKEEVDFSKEEEDKTEEINSSLNESEVFDEDETSLNESEILDEDETSLNESEIFDEDETSLNESEVLDEDETSLNESEILDEERCKEEEERTYSNEYSEIEYFSDDEFSDDESEKER